MTGRTGTRRLRTVAGSLAFAVSIVGVVSVPAVASAAPSGRAKFTAKANQICAQAGTLYGVTTEVTYEAYNPDSVEAAAGLAGGTATLLQREYKQLRQVKAPPPLRKQFALFTSDIQDAGALSSQAVHAAEKGDQSSFTDLNQQYQETKTYSYQLGSQLKLNQCANQGLSRKDASAINHVVVTSLTTNNPSMCTAMMTKAFVNVQFGSLDKCIQAQKAAPSPSSAPSLSGLQGAGDFASLVVTQHGGSNEGKQLNVTVYRQHGKWRVQSAHAA